MNAPINDIAIVILAAGNSSRLGRPKQLLEYDGKSLLRRAVDIAIEVSSNVLVITGSSAEQMSNELHGSAAQVIRNEQWKEGIASSIRLGVEESMNRVPLIRGILFMVSDQPFVSEHLLKEIINKGNAGSQIVASAYGDSLGIPAYFEKGFFSTLLGLSGDNGAKKLILQHLQSAARIEFPEGNIDIDTQKDYEMLRGKK
jgi:molybdenum cofactor cytidylyltransferase